MKYLIAILFLFSFWGIGYNTSSGYLDYNFSNEGQKNQFWCYAAVTQLVFDYYGIPKSQIKIIEELNNVEDCATYADCKDHADSSLCNSMLSRDSLESWRVYINANTGVNYQEQTFEIDAIKDAINQKRGPVIVRLFQNPLYHAVIINGYFEKKAKAITKWFKDDVVFFSVVNPGGNLFTCTNCKYVLKYNTKNNYFESLTGNSYYKVATGIPILVPTLNRP